MTDDPKARDGGKRLDKADFDVVEDIGDEAAFHRALDELLPKGDPSRSAGIDPDDFEAFNRELDAQMALARARTARVDVIEDLGRDVVETTPVRVARHEPASPQPQVAAPPADEAELADDVVTLGTPSAPPVAPAPAAAQPALPPPSSQPAPATTGARAGRGARAALLFGLAGLLAGGAALWLSLEREAELTRLRMSLEQRQTTATPPPTPEPAPTADTEKMQALEGRLDEVTKRLTALSAATPAAAKAPDKAPPADERTVRPEPEALTTMPTPAPEPGPAETAATPAVAPPAPGQTLPKPGGKGSWAVVIDSFADEESAEQRRAQVERLSLPAEVRWLVVKDQVRYRVVIPGYGSQEAANAAAAELRRRKAGGAWVTRLQKQE